MTSNAAGRPTFQRFKISRRGRKLQLLDDQRLLVALPKDVPERIWAEIFQKEENDLLIFDIREEILEEAYKIVYESYMEKQNIFFTVYCAAEAWLQLIDWNFYRHDPGEDPTAYPPCAIPNRKESWAPDEMPEPSPKDTWGKQDLVVVEDSTDESLKKWPSSSSIDMPVLQEIPQEYWFPGKVNIPVEESEEKLERSVSYGDSVRSSSSEEQLGAESEVLQKVTDYITEEITEKRSSMSVQKHPTPADGSLHGAGDSTVDRSKSKRKNKSVASRHSRISLPPLDRSSSGSRSRLSIISDCRLRNPRLDTQYEILSEKVETPTADIIKRK